MLKWTIPDWATSNTCAEGSNESCYDIRRSEGAFCLNWHTMTGTTFLGKFDTLEMAQQAAQRHFER